MLATPSVIRILAPLYQFKIVLVDSAPPIWRRVAVQPDITLHDLHVILQTVMGWHGRYPHVFEIAGVTYAPTTLHWPAKPTVLSDWPRFFFDSFVSCVSAGLLRFLPAAIDERRVKLRALVSEVGAQFAYEYPVASGWKYQITLESFLSNSGRTFKSPVCISGKGGCPPEDCLALAAYEGDLQILREKKTSPAARTDRMLLRRL